MFVDASGNFSFCSRPRRARQRKPFQHRQLCARPWILVSLTYTCGDITVFKIDQTTGRLSLVVNAQVTAANGQPITYFPVPANPVDFVLTGDIVLTLPAPHPHLLSLYVGALGVSYTLFSATDS